MWVFILRGYIECVCECSKVRKKIRARACIAEHNLVVSRHAFTSYYSLHSYYIRCAKLTTKRKHDEKPAGEKPWLACSSKSICSAKN
jgi:hypothetical protein